MLKVIYSVDIGPYVEYERKIVENLKKYGYEIKIIDWLKEIGLKHYPSHEEILRLYEDNDPKLINLYNKISQLAESYDVFIVTQSHVYLPEFIKTLNNIYTVFYSGDDPDSSEICSKPYVEYYDHIFAAGLNFDEKRKITDQFLEWGAKKADWWPLGFRGDTYNNNLKIEDFYNKKRDIDLVFIGNITDNRLDRIIQLKRSFPQMKIYSRIFLNKFLKIPINAYLSFKSRQIFGGQYLPHDEISSIYQRTKIGINMHLSFGPSNMRTYQLPANGVMQICDCPESLSDVFKIGKEVITYYNIEEAIELINYYLENDEERIKIAINGYKRAIKDYNREITFLNALRKIEDNIRNKEI